jgi:hypothetical protein
MEVKLGNFKAIIPQIKMCRDFLKDIFQKENHRQKKGLANTEVCSVLQKQQKEEDSVLVPRMLAALCVECYKAFHSKLNF